MPKSSRPPRRLDRKALEAIASVFRAFAEPTRLAILQELKEGPQNVSTLVDALGTTQANVSKQLRILYDAGILSREKDGNQVFYAIEDDIVYPLCELVCGKLNRERRQDTKILKFSA